MATKRKDRDADVTWIGRASKDAPERLKFAAAFNELLREKQITHTEFAAAMFGRHPKTGAPNGAPNVRGWCTGDKFPEPASAARIAKYFKVPLARLLNPTGPLVSDVQVRAKRTASHKKAPSTAPPPLELPKGAPPLEFSLTDFKKDGRFAHVMISGVAEIDVALALFALIHRKT